VVGAAPGAAVLPGTPVMRPMMRPVVPVMRLIVEQRLSRRPAWWLLDEGRVVAWGGGVFDTLDAAEQAAREVRRTAAGLDYRTQELVDRHWRWTGWLDREHRVVVGMGSYLSQDQARAAAEATRQGLASATGP
jgi:hypothetical protein